MSEETVRLNAHGGPCCSPPKAAGFEPDRLAAQRWLTASLPGQESKLASMIDGAGPNEDDGETVGQWAGEFVLEAHLAGQALALAVHEARARQAVAALARIAEKASAEGEIQRGLGNHFRAERCKGQAHAIHLALDDLMPGWRAEGGGS